ncbi:MAG TPA: glycosyltransferase family 2 protein [Pseudolysinimonas sp.]|nr:glycosyltransferase family 2 protein [Pseudolysinimonas sp.]
MASSPSTPSPAVAVVTVSFHSGEVLAAFLDSVPSASVKATLAIVADNSPEPDPQVTAQVAATSAQHVRLGTNLGYGGAINAIAASLPDTVEWILVSNPDVVLRRGAIDTLVAAGESDPRIGSVGPAIYTSTGEIYPSARSVPSLRTGVGHALFVNLWAGNPWTRAYRREAETTAEARDAGWLSGACVLIRRTAFDELGGFDDGFFMYFEDVDLGHRLGKAGYRNVYAPTATVVHTGAHSTNSDSARMVEVHHESAKRFLSKKYPGPLLWPIRIALRMGLAVRSALVVRKLRAR